MDTRDLKELLGRSEDDLMQRVLDYARRQKYTQYTSTLAEAWRLSIAELSKAIMQACDVQSSPPELQPDDDYTQDPIAAFGILEAQRHRHRGISLAMFLGLLKYYRQSYVDLVEEWPRPPEARRSARLFLERCFDRIELGFTSEWRAVPPGSSWSVASTGSNWASPASGLGPRKTSGCSNSSPPTAA